MSEHVTLYSSHLITFEDLKIALHVAGGESVEPTSDRYSLLGRVEEGDRHVTVWGYSNPKEDPQAFWEKNEPYLGQEVLEEIETKLGAKPLTSFALDIGHAPKSSMLAVELAYQCAIRWPCVVWAEVLKEGNGTVKIYTREDMERLLAEGKDFAGYTLEDYEDEDDEEE
jgi:hypothetical protein